MDFFYLFADSHKYSIPDLEKIRYQPSLFCIYKKTDNTKKHSQDAQQNLSSMTRNAPNHLHMVGLDDILRYRLMLKLYNSWPSQTHAQSLCNTLF